MTDRRKIPPAFRDATRDGAAVAIVDGIDRRMPDADKPVAQAGGRGAGQSEQRTPAEMCTEMGSRATASGATTPSELWAAVAPTRRP